MTRAKFRCLEATRRYSHTQMHSGVEVDYFHYRVRLVPVMWKSKVGGPDCEENKAFYAATPGGEITLEMVSEAAGRSFEPGQAYYVDFSPADG